MDNRDVGLSSKTPGQPPSMDQVLEQLTLEHSLGELLAPYNLSDMAMDCLAVLDALEIEQAQVSCAHEKNNSELPKSGIWL